MRFITLAVIGALSAAGAAKAVASLDIKPSEAAAATSETTLSEGVGPSVAAVTRSSDGHYWAQADVNGKAVKFLVDTGATNVVLTKADALRLGLDPNHLSYNQPVVTADGRTEAAAVTLDHLSIAGARVDHVEALVIAEGLETSLLGMSYLGRLSRFEATPNALILRP